MSLLIEPENQAACARNEKERLLREGLLRQMSQQEYIMKHLGIAKRRPQATVGEAIAATPTMRSSASTPQLGRRTPSQASMPPPTPATGSSVRPNGRMDFSDILERYSTRREPRGMTKMWKPPAEEAEDVVLESVTNTSSPLFSPQLCVSVAKTLNA
mmetsp:Transcript_3268/g.5281  ORF Transcript_3268/g.5281 Transcript_3268/m.5281 type:complete len:157 (+) Transcript_3268:96-566(+)